MAAPSLQDGIDKAGSPVNLLWRVNPEPWNPENIEPEYAGWRTEQAAWHSGVSISDLSHHMFDTFIAGPDATALLTAVSANNYESFAIGQAKQFIPVTSRGSIVTDGILERTAEREYTLSGIPAAQNWVKYHGEQGGYDVSFSTDPSSAFRGGADPRLFRYQVQGPLARDLVESVFGGPLPPAKFFHSVPVVLDGMEFRALRHNMAGQDGYEFIGPWRFAAAVKDTLLQAGEKFGLVHVGALAYASASVESGWIPSPVPAIYTDPELAGYRAWLPLFGIEGQRPLDGSFFSENIEDYYCTPYELGYGRSISFNHDFIGRDALLAARESVDAHQGHAGVRPVRRARGAGRGPGLLPHLRAAPGGGFLWSGGPDLPDGHHRPGGDDPGADDHRQAVRRAGHRGVGGVGRAPGRGHVSRRRPGLPAHPRHGRARAVRRARADAIPALLIAHGCFCGQPQ